MTQYLNLAQLNSTQLRQYRDAVPKAFPSIICESQVIKNNWSRLEKYFPEYQLFLISSEGHLIGFMNMVPFYFDKYLVDLPDNGWDWMFDTGVDGFENHQAPNYLGGLQVIVTGDYQRQGYSKQIIAHAKEVCRDSTLEKVLIPIRPTKKHLQPKMSMTEYMTLIEDQEIYDPWIRTHMKAGAQVIKICNESMTIGGDVHFWERILNREIKSSGEYELAGALSLVKIDVDHNTGVYKEPNIWIKYD